MAVLRAFFFLLLFQMIGEVLRLVVHLPIPSPVIGMALLAAWYMLRKREPEPALQKTADTLLAWMGLFFVPAGVGIMTDIALLRSAWLPIMISVVISTFLTLAVTAWVMQRFGKSAV